MSLNVKYKALGAAQTVTGSKHLLSTDQFKLFIDCGLYQGEKKLENLNWDPLSIEAKEIDAIILTHSHLDHCGYLPKLVRDGFRGKIYSTLLTKEVSEIILKDAAQIQMSDAQQVAKVNKKHKTASPLYYSNDIPFTMSFFETKELETPFQLGPFQIEFFEAGHVPGAISAGISWEESNILFSGDLGRDDDPLSFYPEVKKPFKNIVMESTYGGINHPVEQRLSDLKEAVTKVRHSAGTLLIPAFSLARTQILLYYLKELFEKFPDLSLPVYLNSPMAFAINDVFKKHPELVKMDFKDLVDNFKQLKVTEEHWQAKKLYDSVETKIIISASGMLSGGRVMKHFELLAENPDNFILIAGYQAEGTIGHELLAGRKDFEVNQHKVHLAAKVLNSHAFSAHADENQLINWLYKHKESMENIYLVHGEADHILALGKRVAKEYPLVQIHAPKVEESFIIT